MRDWLLVLGPVFIIGILLHGYWRMRVNRNTIRMELDKSFMSKPGERLGEDVDDFSMLKAELPNGGARVRRIPEQVTLDLEEDVPVLMESVDVPDQGVPAGSDADETAEDPPARLPADDAPEHFVVLYVTAVDGLFAGQRLLEALVELDMQFGEMDIFHRLDDAGDPAFSLVNAVEPGTFDLSTMDSLETPAISLFMRTHERADPVATFDAMIEVAQHLALELCGEVKDQSRSVMTPQTIEHCREDIQAYVLRYR
ncbi:MAG: cell division protein ZipA [Pseudomonadota bacterium]